MRNRRFTPIRVSTALATLTAISACGQGHKNSPEQQTTLKLGAEVVTQPPKAFYDSLFTAKLALLDGSQTVVAPAAATSGASSGNGDLSVSITPAVPPAIVTPPAPGVLWINFGGATVNQGYAKGESFLLCKAKVTIPAATSLSPADQAQVVNAVQQFYTAAGANLTVTSTQPTSGDYKTVEVGGTLTDLGCPDHGEFGAAPLDVGNANPNDLSFVFLPSGIGTQQLAVNIAHVSAHTFGLGNVTNATDIMAETPSATAVGFADASLVKDGSDQNEPALLAAATGVPVTSRDPAGNTTAGTGTASGSGTSQSNLPQGTQAHPSSSSEVLVDEILAYLPAHPTDVNQIIPLIQSLLPTASKLDPATVTKIINDSGLGQGQPGTSTSTTTTTQSDGTTITTTTINVNLNVYINGVWQGLEDSERTLGMPPSTQSTIPGTSQQGSGASSQSNVPPSLQHDASGQQLPKNPAQLAQAINNMTTIYNIINNNFNIHESKKLFPLFQMGCLQKFLTARGP